MTSLWILFPAAALLTALLVFEKGGRTIPVLLTKTPLSALFILTAIIRPHPQTAYFQFLLAGLVCCLAGDVCLALPQPRMFLLGLVAFLCGHVMYVIGFFSLSGINAWAAAGALAAIPAAGWVYRWLKPHLGPLRVPVILYIAVISLMVCAAGSVAGDPHIARMAKALVFTGALSFYLSDIFVARQRFVAPSFLNRLAGLPLYYLGQFMLAFSVAYA